MPFPVARSAVLLGLMCLSPTALTAKEMDGKAIYKYCKACHGAHAEGGQDGKYPRLAGLPQSYLERQLHAFKDRKRLNKPMIPIFKHVRFDASVIERVAGYLAGLSEPELNLWPYRASEQAVAGFGSKAEFLAAGEKAYQADCAGCHGDQGLGGEQPGAPPLVNQYPAYLGKQMRDFADGARVHGHSDACGSPSPGLREAVLNRVVELGK